MEGTSSENISSMQSSEMEEVLDDAEKAIRLW